LILSHGQATVEEGFSVNWHVMIKNMKEQTFTAQHEIYGHNQSIGGLVQGDNVTLPLLKSRRKSNSKHLKTGS